MPVMVLPIAGFEWSSPKGAAAASSGVSTNGRIEAWGQTYEQRLHWIQLAVIHWGTKAATPRFS